jgi:acyl carrier protein
VNGVERVVRDALRDHGRLTADAEQLATTDDLYAAGLTSHAAVTVMLACEDAYDVEFEAKHLNRATFASIAAISAALAEVGVAT